MKKKLALIALIGTLFGGAYLSAQFFPRENVWVDCGDGTYARVCQSGGTGCSGFLPCQ